MEALASGIITELRFHALMILLALSIYKHESLASHFLAIGRRLLGYRPSIRPEAPNIRLVYVGSNQEAVIRSLIQLAVLARFYFLLAHLFKVLFCQSLIINLPLRCAPATLAP
jgi:hypothetical protein